MNAFQALELRLEDFLDKKMTAQGLPDTDIEERLGRTWRTKERLKELVPSLSGRRLIDDDPKLWDRFCWAYDDIRNKLIHAARDLDRGGRLPRCRSVAQRDCMIPGCPQAIRIVRTT